MIIIEKNTGEKIPFEVNENKTTICFDDDLTIKLAKREKDDPVHIDICYDEDGELSVGAAAGWAYVAEIDIPARRYEEVEDPDYVPQEGETEGAVHTKLVPLPLDMETVTLTLWAVE